MPHCPRCHGYPLERFASAGREVDVCAKCGGLWCEVGDWDKVALGEFPARTPDLAPANDLTAVAGRGMSCPGCGVKMSAFAVLGIKDLELDQCPQCGGVWFDKREWDELEASRTWQAHVTDSARKTTWSEWFLQLFLSLPVEFNIRPRRVPVVTLSIVAVCAVLYLASFAIDLEFLALKPTAALSFAGVATMITHSFVHLNWLHLLGNMYFLYILGDNVEDVLGRWRFLLFYFACDLVSTAAHVAADPSSDIPMVGASGAVAAVMAAYLVLFWHARLTMMLLVFQIKVPVWIWMGLWIAIQVAAMFYDPSGEKTHVAFAAHVAGFAAGLVFILPLRRGLVANHPLLRLLSLRRLERGK